MYKKGEWYIEDRHTAIAVLCIPEGKDRAIVIADLDTSDCTLEEDEANASLMAAAPRMAKLLANMCAKFEDYGEVDESFYCAARNILVALAMGE